MEALPTQRKDKIHVLVFPCGSEPALEIHTALRYVVNVEVYGASSRADHGEFIYRNYIGDLPYINASSFLPRFKELLRTHRIDVVFPTHDTIAQFLSTHREELSAHICVAEQRTADLCRNKADTYALFKDETFCPRVFTLEEALASAHYPLFLKPSIDEGGKGARRIADAEELRFFTNRTPSPVIMEYLPGEEYTVDCFTDRHGKLRFAGARTRERVWAGISVRSSTRSEDQETAEIAERINQRVRFRGLWFFQVKRAADGQLRLLEICGRVAGTMNVHRIQGVNLPLLTVYDAVGRDVSLTPNTFSVTVERSLFNRYRLGIEYDAVYVDLDDTLICREQVNGLLLMFLYQARAQQKRIVLVTKHEADLKATLARHAIDPGLFDDIKHLPRTGTKLESLASVSRAIFIDNAFNERLPFQRAGVPVFDVDAVYGLIDWRD